jgi:polyisoprenoid-binding protein YceI
MGNRIVLLLGAGIIFAIGIGAGFVLNNALLAGDGEASEEIAAPTLDPNVTPTPGYSQVVATNEALSTALAEAQNQPDDIQATPEAAEDVAPTATPTTESDPVATEDTSAATDEETEMTDTDGGERLLFRINQPESEVRFNIDENLRGSDITVVGITDQVAGDVVVDFGNPGSSQIGIIRINVRTLETDNRFRNDAIRGRILESARDEYEFAEFVPTDLSGLPETVGVGETVEFQIIGDLTLRDVTRSVTFETEVTLAAEDRIEGYASTTILYPDFNLTIPDVPGVSDISDDVVLEIDFVALLVEEDTAT